MLKKKFDFLPSLPQGYSRVPSIDVTEVGLAVWPAKSDIYTN